jgi:hypothetical protein
MHHCLLMRLSRIVGIAIASATLAIIMSLHTVREGNPSADDAVYRAKQSEAIPPRNKGSTETKLQSMQQHYRIVPRGDKQYEMIFDLAAEWAKVDTSAALWFGIKGVRPSDRERLVLLCCASFDTQTLSHMYLVERDPDIKDAFCIGLLHRYVQGGNLKEALSMVDSMPDREKGGILFQHIMNKISIGTLVNDAASLTRDSRFPSIQLALSQRLGTETPFYALQHFDLLFTTPEARRSAISTVSRGLAATDLNTALIWMQSGRLSQSEVDIATGSVATVLARRDPDAAIEWLASIDDEAVRNKYIAYAFHETVFP